MFGERCVQRPVIVPSVLTCPCILSPLDNFNQAELPSANCEILFCINKYSESILLLHIQVYLKQLHQQLVYHQA